jgi:hypothetical protein
MLVDDRTPQSGEAMNSSPFPSAMSSPSAPSQSVHAHSSVLEPKQRILSPCYDRWRARSRSSEVSLTLPIDCLVEHFLDLSVFRAMSIYGSCEEALWLPVTHVYAALVQQYCDDPGMPIYRSYDERCLA